MDVSVSDAKGQLTDLVRRAEAGEEVVLTRHGQPVARISPIAPARLGLSERAKRLDAVIAQARAKVEPGLSGKQLQDELYDDAGLPG